MFVATPVGFQMKLRLGNCELFENGLFIPVLFGMTCVLKVKKKAIVFTLFNFENKKRLN